MLKTSWNDGIKNGGLRRVKEERNVVHEIKWRQDNWIGHILRRNFILNHVIGVKIEGMRRRGRKRRQLLNDLKETRRSWKLKEEAIRRTPWRIRFVGGCGHVVRQTACWPSCSLQIQTYCVCVCMCVRACMLIKGDTMYMWSTMLKTLAHPTVLCSGCEDFTRWNFRLWYSDAWFHLVSYRRFGGT